MNQPELERTLRAAYRARTDAVTAADLHHEPPDLAAEEPETAVPSTQRMTWLPFLAAAAVVALVAATMIIVQVFGTSSDSGPRPLRFTKPTPTVTTWPGAPAGSSVALWAPSASATTRTVFLVDPTGQRTAIRTLTDAGDARLVAWSTDRTTVAIENEPAGRAPWVAILTLPTKAMTTFPLTDAERYGGFTTPDGATGVVVRGQTARVVDRRGALVSSRPATANERAAAVGTPGSISATVNGTAVTISGSKPFVVSAADGHQVTSVATPRGQACTAVRVWSPTAVLARCPSGMWAVPLDASPPTLLATPDPGVRGKDGTVDHVYQLSDLWPVDGGVFGYETPPCGADGVFVKIDAQQVPRRLSGVSGAPVGATGATLYYVQQSGGCQAPVSTYDAYTPATKMVTTLLGGSANGGTVLSALVAERE
jgi:hypothetical protein